MRLLLDENCPGPLVNMLVQEEPSMPILRLRDWQGGRFMGQEDADILRTAAKEGLTLFTFDVSTIPRVLVEMAVQGESHAGVVFASSKRTPQRDYASFAHALVRLWRRERAAEWTDRVAFLSVRPE